jgi:hypothetical protein
MGYPPTIQPAGVPADRQISVSARVKERPLPLATAARVPAYAVPSGCCYAEQANPTWDRSTWLSPIAARAAPGRAATPPRRSLRQSRRNPSVPAVPPGSPAPASGRRRAGRELLPYFRHELEDADGPDHEGGWWSTDAPPRGVAAWRPGPRQASSACHRWSSSTKSATS